jgi:hypothetical protein
MTNLFPNLRAALRISAAGQKFLLRAKPAPINRTGYRRDDERRHGCKLQFLSSQLQKNVLTLDKKLLT